MTATTLAAPATQAPESRRTSPHTAVWFEIPVRNLPASIRFYEAAFATQLKLDPRFPGLAIFPRKATDSVTGALIELEPASIPGALTQIDPAQARRSSGTHESTIVYFSCDGQLDRVLQRALDHGATILKEVAQLPGNMGFIGQIQDPEGNRIGLHANF